MATRKRKTTSPSGAKKKRLTPDWRVPLFYWRGAIDHDVSWAGTWVAAEELPSGQHFAASANKFRLEGGRPFGSGAPTQFELSLDGKYLLDNGGGLQEYSDHKHDISIRPVVTNKYEQQWSVVGARGTTEFGDFISLGVLVLPHDGGSSETSMLLVRRYISEDDARCELTATSVAEQATETFMTHFSNRGRGDEYALPEYEDFLQLLPSKLLPWKPLSE